MSAPTDCNLCRIEFLSRPMLQAEAAYIAATQGAATSAAWVSEELNEAHASHGISP
jgi:hypothetical protein